MLVDHDDNAEGTAMEIDSDGDDNAGSSAARTTQQAAPGKKKSASETYQKVRRGWLVGGRRIDGISPIAYTTGTHSQTPRLIYRER